MSAYGEMAFGAGLGIISGAINNQWAKEREAQAREENYKYSEQAADNADARTRALYEDYQSPEALLRQYKKAGLSPSLMFANGAAGAGGMTQGAQGAGAAGISPTTYGVNLLEGAQLALTKAQARKLNAEADTEEGKNERGQTEIEATKTNIAKRIAETHNEGLKSAWYEYENALQSIKVGVEASTYEAQVENFINECNYLKHKIRSAKVRAEIDEATEQDAIRLTQKNVENVIADTLLKGIQKQLANSQIEVNKEQVKNLADEIINRGKNTTINENTISQTIREWEVENGIFSGNDANWHEIIQKKLFSEHTEDLIIKLIQAFLAVK